MPTSDKGLGSFAFGTIGFDRFDRATIAMMIIAFLRASIITLLWAFEPIRKFECVGFAADFLSIKRPETHPSELTIVKHTHRTGGR